MAGLENCSSFSMFFLLKPAGPSFLSITLKMPLRIWSMVSAGGWT